MAFGKNSYKIVLSNLGAVKQLDDGKLPTAVLTISVNQLNTTGPKLESIVQKISKRFSHCDFMLCDTLNRFSLMINDHHLDEATAQKLALNHGDVWLEHNQQYLDVVTIPSKLIRWDAWLTHPDYNKKLDLIQTEMKVNLQYKEAMFSTAAMYLSRQGLLDSERDIGLCMNYLQEECAVMLLWAEQGYNFELYPAASNIAVQKTRDIFVAPRHPDIMLHSKIDVKYNLHKEREIASSALESLLHIANGHVYVKDVDGYYLFCNELQAKSLGLKPTEIIGKTDYDLSPKERADEYWQADSEVMQTGKIVVLEEAAFYNERNATFLSTKAPLYDKYHKVLGLLGISVDITAQKEAERLRLEKAEEAARAELIREKHLLLQQQQEKFKNIVRKGAHDMRSPLAVLQMIINHYAESMPDDIRTDCNFAFTRFLEIANDTLDYMGNSDTNMFDIDVEAPILRTILLAPELTSILTEKKYEYTEKSVKFINAIQDGNHFICVNLDVKAFRRSMSNIINNAVDALDGKSDGEIIITLESTNDMVTVNIHDNGKGMLEEVKQKILNAVAVTADKVGGHGVGLNQVREMLSNNHGTLAIKSELKVGTTVTLSFPKAAPPKWLATEVHLAEKAIVVIVDDEPMVHADWKERFRAYDRKIKVQHFDNGTDAINFIRKLTATEQQRLCLLVDYQLASKEINGLKVIKHAPSAQSILVTNFYNDPLILEASADNSFKILPKILVNEIAVH